MKAATLEDHVLWFGALSDATRLRLLALLEVHELSVVELTHVTELGQSKVSMHLSRLKELGFVTDRKVGTSAFYRLQREAMPALGKKLWETVRPSLDDKVLTRDLARARQVIEARNTQSWPERMAGELERHYSPGRTWDSLARAFVGLIRAGSVLDIGAGDGTVAEMIAPRAKRYVCVDASETMCDAARRRLSKVENVKVEHGDMHALPFEDASFDHVLMLNVLAYAERPQVALREASRMLKERGDLVLVTVAKHDHMDVASHYGHRQPGFTVRFLEKSLKEVGLIVSSAEITSRERARPNFEIITCFAQKRA